jgi:hypothetical protein
MSAPDVHRRGTSSRHSGRPPSHASARISADARPDRGVPSTGPRCRRSAPVLPIAGRRCGCRRHDARANCGSRSTSGARFSPADRIAPHANRGTIMILGRSRRRRGFWSPASRRSPHTRGADGSPIRRAPALRYGQGADTGIEQSASAGLAMVRTHPMNPGRYQCRSLSPLKTPTPRMPTHQPRPRPRPKPKPKLTSLPFTQIGLPDARRARRHHSLNRMERASAPAAGARSRVRASGVPAVAADPLTVRSSTHGSLCPRRCGRGSRWGAAGRSRRR